MLTLTQMLDLAVSYTLLQSCPSMPSSDRLWREVGSPNPFDQHWSPLGCALKVWQPNLPRGAVHGLPALFEHVGLLLPCGTSVLCNGSICMSLRRSLQFTGECAWDVIRICKSALCIISILNAFEMTVSGRRIDVVDWNGWLASLCWCRRGKAMQEEWQHLYCSEWHNRKDTDGCKGGAKVTG